MTPSKIVKQNLERLLAHDGRTHSDLGRAAAELHPERGASAWRKAFALAFLSGWPPDDVAQALADVFGISLERLVTAGGVPETLSLSERPSVNDDVEFRAGDHVHVATIGKLLGVSRKRLDAMSRLQIEVALDDAFEAWRADLGGGWELR